jgi:predicted ferric reductase
LALRTTNDTGEVDIASNPSTSFSVAFPFSAGLTGINQNENFIYVHALIITFCLLVLLTICLQWIKSVIAYLRQASVVGNPRDQKFWAGNRTSWWPWLKQHFLYAPLWKLRHNREIKISSAISIGTLPSRAHMVLLISYCICNLAYALAISYNGSVEEIVASLRARAGTLAALNLIPTVLFALRNNPLIWMLEVPYDTFNLFHRWLARITIFETVLHVLFWTGNTVRAGGWHAVHEGLTEGSHAKSFGNGLAGVILFIIIAAQAWSPLRHAFYETFLNIHKLVVAAALITAYLHLKLDSLPQHPWLEIVFSLWILEYVFRFARITYYNISISRFTRITVEALPAEACRVTFELVRPWRPQPGTHVHIYIPTLAWLSSHPFSVAWTETRPISTTLSPLDTEKALTGDLPPSLDNDPTSQTTSISLICRARTGFTRHMYDRAVAQPNRTWHTWGAAEGPYGALDSLASYGTVLLFAGGVGITHQLSHLSPLISGSCDGTVATRKIVLVWSVPSAECLEWVRPWMDRVLRMKGRREVLKIMLFVTKPKRKEEVRSGTGSVLMVPGRCKPGIVIDKEMVERVGAMAVTVCGPGAFADEVRRSARRRVSVGVLDFVEEAFTY